MTEKPVRDMSIDELYAHGARMRDYWYRGIPAETIQSLLERWISDLQTYQELSSEKAEGLRKKLLDEH